MKKLLVISIYLVFGITLMRGNGVLTPSKAELLQISSKGNIASEATFLEIGRSPGALFVPHKRRVIATRGLLMETGFADFAPMQIGTPTQAVLSTFTRPVELELMDTATWGPVLTETLPLTPTFTRTPISVLKSIKAETPVGSPSPISVGTAIPSLKRKEIPTTTLSPTSIATATTWATWTATVTGVATNMATYTVGVQPEPPSPLLDRLIKNKPSLWGNKGFYVLLGTLYLTLLGLFLRQILDTIKRRP